jgi:integrase
LSSIWKRTLAGGRTRWCVNYTDQHGRRHSKTTFTTKKAAQDYRRLVEGEVDRGVHTPESTSITVGAAADLWLRRAEVNELERSTIRAYRNHLAHITPIIGGVKLAKLSTPVVETFKDELLARLSRPLARKVLASLKSIIGDAQRRGLIAHNPATPVKVDAKVRDKRKLEVGVDIPSMGDVNALLEAAAGRFRPFLVTAVFTGMRASELRGLPWSAIDFDRRTVTVRQRADEWGVIGAPKSAAGRRDIPMSPMVYNTLREWKLSCPASPLDLVFPTTTGGVQRHSNLVSRQYEPLQRVVFGEVRFGLHALRHFFASWCISQNLSPKRIQTLMGHSSITMTYDTYGHLLGDTEDTHGKFATAEVLIREAR